ncbi:MAG TPA: DUF3276 family protein [Tepidisphaeraceae bacterium]|nr:DUF3276 family protein [Tepidisphaeraceae bacterium]
MSQAQQAQTQFRPKRPRSGTSKGSPSRNFSAKPDKDKQPDPILFQTYFKSVGPRTYAAQMKKARNGNHYLVLTEGKRDAKTNELKKISLFLFSEDFQRFFHLMRETAEWIKANPVDPEVAEKQAKRWKEKEKREPIAQ